MHDEAVCLGCGQVVGGPAGTSCACAALSASAEGAPASAPSSALSSTPYREAPPHAACPRCEGRLLEGTVDSGVALSCTSCGGVFLTKELVDRLEQPGSGALRLAFPRHAPSPVPLPVRYLACPDCTRPMNRVDFGRSSRVIVDVCKDHGIWFDAGEVHAVIDFVEKGGLERARARAEQERQAENERLRASARQIRGEAQEVRIYRRRELRFTSGERQLVTRFFDWLGG